MNKAQLLRLLDKKLDQMDESDPEYEALSAKADELYASIEADHRRVELAEQQAKERALVEQRKIKAEEIEARLTVRFGTWDAWAKSLYIIEEIELTRFRLISKAKNWSDDNPKEWIFDSKLECLEKIEQLIEWKEYDRARGSGDVKKDLGVI